MLNRYRLVPLSVSLFGNSFILSGLVRTMLARHSYGTAAIDPAMQLDMRETNLQVPLVFRSVSGSLYRANDVVVYGTPASSTAAVYFGGDIQDFEDEMVATGSVQYLPWSLQSTVKILSRKFPDSCAIAIRPSRKVDYVVSCFDNFVRSTVYGPTSYDPNHGGLVHFEALLDSVSGLLHRPEGFEKIILLGFSKGSVVLNQFLHEIVDIHQKKLEQPGILGKLKSLYWLDAGHSSTVDYWPTDPDALHALKAITGVNEVHIVSTPFQLERPGRPLYKPQLDTFCDICGKLGLLKQNVNLFSGQTYANTTIEDHFRVLDRFSAGMIVE